jgi:acetylornithine/succinyldiaminopimelate/putrescine aminotransferase
VLSERAGAWLDRDGWAHVSTFGGAELGCAVADKVLALTDDPARLARVRALSDRFARGLADIAARRPFLVEVRQRGLVIGLRFAHEMGGMMMTQKLYQRGVWAIFAAHDRSVLQWKPGLLLDDALADEVLDRLDAALAESP